MDVLINVVANQNANCVCCGGANDVTCTTTNLLSVGCLNIRRLIIVSSLLCAGGGSFPKNFPKGGQNFLQIIQRAQSFFLTGESQKFLGGLTQEETMGNAENLSKNVLLANSLPVVMYF